MGFNSVSDRSGGEKGKIKVYEDEKEDRFGNYPALWIKGKDANPQKIYEELWERYGGQGYKFAIVFDCSKDEWEDQQEDRKSPPTGCSAILFYVDFIIVHSGGSRQPLFDVRREISENLRGPPCFFLKKV